MSSSTTTSSTSDSHIHSGRRCPVSGEHEYCPPQEGDSRSPCPALNAMANHGYIPRDGQKITVIDLVKGLRGCYGLSLPLAIVLAFGGFFLLKRVKPVSLYHIGKHNAIEHNASLVHEDCAKDQKYASVKVVPQLIEALTHEKCSDDGSTTSDESALLDIKELAKFRVRRERECLPVDGIHAEIARGEMAIVLGMWGEKISDHGVPKAWLRDWLNEERLPKDWKPCRKQGLLDTMHISKELKSHMEQFKSSSAPTQ
ncbi:Chloroperoxidase [Amanita muscaria]